MGLTNLANDMTCACTSERVAAIQWSPLFKGSNVRLWNEGIPRNQNSRISPDYVNREIYETSPEMRSPHMVRTHSMGWSKGVWTVYITTFVDISQNCNQPLTHLWFKCRQMASGSLRNLRKIITCGSCIHGFRPTENFLLHGRFVSLVSQMR